MQPQAALCKMRRPFHQLRQSIKGKRQARGEHVICHACRGGVEAGRLPPFLCSVGSGYKWRSAGFVLFASCTLIGATSLLCIVE